MSDSTVAVPRTELMAQTNRICPGRWLAMDNIWIAVATTAAAFDISQKLDETGQPIEPSVEFSSTMLR